MSKFEITEDMALKGVLCPSCGEFYVGNGTGPESSPTLRKWLSTLPSDHILRYGAMFHDFAYHCGPSWGSQLEADQLMLNKNEERIQQKCSWYSKWFYYSMNWRNYIMVRQFGESSYNSKGCK